MTALRFDAVVVLGKELRSGPERARRELAARAAAASAALRAGVPLLVSTEGRLRGQDRAGSEIVAGLLDELGVPAERRVLLRASRSTRDEARLVGRLYRARSWRRVLVVTAGYHVRRARRMFERELGPAGVALHAPEALLRWADARERAWIEAGHADPAALRAEVRRERLLRAVAALLDALPAGPAVESTAAGLWRRPEAQC